VNLYSALRENTSNALQTHTEGFRHSHSIKGLLLKHCGNLTLPMTYTRTVLNENQIKVIQAGPGLEMGKCVVTL